MPHVNELHEQHDQLLVVSFASGDLAADDRDRAQSLVESCADCARLHDDVLAIARATRALPPPVRTRDFQISPEQAAKLQPGGWRRFVAAFSAPGSIFSRQLGVGMATLGIVGLLIGAAPSVQLGLGGSAAASAAPASAPAAERAPAFATAQPGAVELHGMGDASPAASAAAASQGPLPVAAGPAGSPSPGFDTLGSEPTRNVSGAFGSTATPLPTPQSVVAANPADQGGGSGPSVVSPAPAPESSAGGPSGLVIVSSILLAAGLLVLLLRSIGRRAAAG